MANPLGTPLGADPDRQTFEPSESLPIGQHERLAWFDEFIGGMLAGGIYLLGGSPGGRKSGLATQIVLELGLHGVPSVSILIEESETRFAQRSGKISSDWLRKDAEAAIRGKVSVFAHAVKSSDIHVVIASDDLRQMRLGWSEAQANAFLRDHAELIAGEMLTAGMAMLVVLLEGGNCAN